MKPPKILSQKTVAQTRLFKVERVSIRFSNGQEREFERFANIRRPAVLIVPLLDAKTVLLTREYGVGLEDYHLSLPKGGIDAGESILQAAHRELQEEVGYGAQHIEHLLSCSNTPSYSSSRMDVVLATDLYPSKLEGDEPEPIEVIPTPLDTIPTLIAQGEIHEARAIAALLWVNHLPR